MMISAPLEFKWQARLAKTPNATARHTASNPPAEPARTPCNNTAIHHASVYFLFPLSCPIHCRPRPGELTHTSFFQPYHPRRRNMTEQHQWIFQCPSGHRLHLDLDRDLPRPKSTDSHRLYCHSRNVDPDGKFPRLEREHHGQFNELKLNDELDLHTADLYRTSTNCSHRCQRWRRVKRCSDARSVRTGRCIWSTGWLCLWSDFITMERNGCRHRRSHHWRFAPLTLVITWTTAPSFFSIIPWIDDGRHVTDIYEYVDTDLMMKFFACEQYLDCQAALCVMPSRGDEFEISKYVA